jgi:amino acid adenylation domain-containing protein
MLVHRFLERSANDAPDRVALIEPQRSISYGELNRLSNRVANALIAAGVQRHDRVVIALENSVEFVAAYMGTMKAGAAAVPLPAGPRSDRLAKALLDSEPTVCIVDAATAAGAKNGHPLATVRCLFICGEEPQSNATFPANRRSWREVAEASTEPCGARVIDLDLAAIVYTSGSTGEPRGVMLTHQNIVANTRSIVSYLQLTSSDRVMCVLPFYYVYGLSLLQTHLAVGGSVVIDNRFAFPNVVLQAMREHGVTGLAGVPSTFAILLHRSSLVDMEFTQLRYVTQAGGALPAARVREWLERGPRVPFYVMYGATEASARLAYLDPRELSRKLGSLGRAIPNVRLTTVREDGTVASPGEVGEIIARGSNVAVGYWNDAEETNRKFDAHGYHTGDMGYVDRDGFLFLAGRRHDMIKVGAHRVGAKEIEDVLNEHPSVHEAAVIAVPHDLLGEAPLAVVALRERLDNASETLRTFCAKRLPPYKVPVDVALRGELPKIAGIGKIDKRLLLQETAGTQLARVR